MENATRLRLLYIGRMLYELTDEDTYLTTAQIMALLKERYNLDTHRQTVKADIELLRLYGMDIQEIKSTQNKYNLIDRTFDVAELKLLIDAVHSSKFISKKKSDELTEKLCTLASKNKSTELARHLSVEGRIKTGGENGMIVVDTVNDAINHNRKISFCYFRYNEKKEKVLKHDGKPYVLTPLHLIWNGDYYYMIGIPKGRDGIRVFRVDRILSCPDVLDEPGDTPPADFDINCYLNTTFRMFNCEHEYVTLVCSNSTMDAIIDRFGINAETYVNDENTFIAKVNVATSHVFYSWIFGFGGLVKIKAPEKAKNEYTEMLKKAMSEE